MATEVTRHQVYYLDVVIIQVENKLFKIPREILTSKSPVFADMFSIATEEGAEVDGSSDARPLRLEQVTSKEFERLLQILYPLKMEASLSPSSWRETEWLSVLGLADKWQMSGILNMALENLRNIVPSTTKISFGQRYDYPSWVLEGFVNLCLREEPITEEEGHELGVDNLVKCAMVREKLWEETAHASYQEGNKSDKHRRPTVTRTRYGGNIFTAEQIVKDVLGFTPDIGFA